MDPTSRVKDPAYPLGIESSTRPFGGPVYAEQWHIHCERRCS